MNTKFILVFTMSLIILQPALGMDKTTKNKNSWIGDGYKKNMAAAFLGGIGTYYFIKPKTLLGLIVTSFAGNIGGSILYRNITISGGLYDVALDLEKLRKLRVFKAVKENGNLSDAFKYDRPFADNEELSNKIHHLTKKFMAIEDRLEWTAQRTTNEKLIIEIEEELTHVRQDIKDLQNTKI